MAVLKVLEEVCYKIILLHIASNVWWTINIHLTSMHFKLTINIIIINNNLRKKHWQNIPITINMLNSIPFFNSFSECLKIALCVLLLKVIKYLHVLCAADSLQQHEPTLYRNIFSWKSTVKYVLHLHIIQAIQVHFCRRGGWISVSPMCTFVLHFTTLFGFILLSYLLQFMWCS